MTKEIRVTQPLDHFKEQWYIDWVCRVGKAEAKRVSTEAMAIGTAVDECIKTGSTKATKHKVEIKNCLSAYNKWKEVYKPASVVSGTRLYYQLNDIKISGEPDLYVDGVLVDIKCAKKISLKYWIQVNMYAYLKNFDTFMKNTDGEMIKKVAILRLDKITGSYEYVVEDYDPNCVNVWFGLMWAMVYLKGEEDNGGVDI